MGLVYFNFSLMEDSSLPAEKASFQWIYIPSGVDDLELGLIISEFKIACAQFKFLSERLLLEERLLFACLFNSLEWWFKVVVIVTRQRSL